MPVRTRAWRLLAAVSLPTLTLSAQAHAQAVSAGDPPIQLAAAETQALGDIVVTAERRETSLQRTPIAISAAR